MADLNVNTSETSQTFENLMFGLFDSHYNFGYSTIATAPSPASSGTQLTVASGDGSDFSPGTYNATIWPAGSQPLDDNAEIVRVTGISGDILQIQRAQENTTARTILVGDQIASSITAKNFSNIESGNNLGANALSTSAITLGYTQIVTGSNLTTTSTSAVQATNLTVTVTIPTGGRYVKITAYSGGMFNSTAGDGYALSIWDGTVGSGTQLVYGIFGQSGISGGAVENPVVIMSVSIPPAGAVKTYNVGFNAVGAGTANLVNAGNTPAFILVEAI